MVRLVSNCVIKSCLEMSLHSLEEALLERLPHCSSRVDDSEAVTDGRCLFQVVAPPHCILLKRLEGASCDRQHAMELCLHRDIMVSQPHMGVHVGLRKGRGA